jgi:hypothetical protein
MLSLLRSLRLLALVVWVGGIIFFAFVVAPVAFHNLPNAHEAGIVVRNSLLVLDRMAFVSGAIYLLASLSLLIRSKARSRNQIAQLLLVCLMAGITGYLEAGILPAMERDRAQTGGSIETASPDDPARLDFERRHVLSERCEGTVLFLGLAVCILLACEPLPTAPSA